MSRPLIGDTTSEVRLESRAEPLPEGDPPQRKMPLGMVYMRAVELAGGIPVVLPPLGHDAIAPLLDRLCGVCLSGGYDIDPHGYLIEGSIERRQAGRTRVSTHRVRIDRGSRLATVMGVTEAEVNSFHHQAAHRLGQGLRAVAWAPDGIVEAIEDDGEAMYLGIQWHVETLVHLPRHARLFEALVAAAAGATQRRAA
jgi:putative glutamine amidotransferase